MKLNKKGFAFSTMLYGTIALIAAVLYVILNVYKSSQDTTYYYGEEILQDLNECVTEEIALENCFSSGKQLCTTVVNNSCCDATAYHACLGVSDSTAQDKGVIIAETLKGNVVTTGSGLYADPYVTNRYIYVGDVVDNYLEYSNKIWRIVSIEPSGAILLIDTTKYITTAWDTDNNGIWRDSTLLSNLNNNYLTTIADNSKLVYNNWLQSFIYPALSQSTLSLDELVNQEHNDEEANTIESKKVGILSISDYMKATPNAKCKSKVLVETACNSWLAAYKGWLSNVSGEQGSDEDGHYAYYFDTGNKISLDKTNVEHDVYPVIYLDRNSVIAGGYGTQGNPYVLK